MYRTLSAVLSVLGFIVVIKLGLKHFSHVDSEYDRSKREDYKDNLPNDGTGLNAPAWASGHAVSARDRFVSLDKEIQNTTSPMDDQ